MPISRASISGPGVAAGLGAGLAAALLSMLVAQKTSFAVAMGFVAPLPIMIAAVGFGSITGLIAVAVGAVIVALLDMRPEGLVIVWPVKLESAGLDVLVFGVSLGLPSWLLGRLAAAPVPDLAVETPGRDRPEECRLGRILMAAVGFAAVGIALDFAVTITKEGGFTTFMANAIAEAEPIVRSLLAANRPLPKGLTVHEIAMGVTWARMPLLSAAGVVLLVFNLWCAARIAQTSNLLTGAWPDIPRYARVPRSLSLALAVALGLSFSGGLVGAMALIVSGALLMGFALQGLAVIHAVTRGKTFRLPLLIIVYLSMAMMPWLLILYAMIGLTDTGFAFRDRPKTPVQTPGPWQPPTSRDR